jgi:hypothetical protein
MKKEKSKEERNRPMREKGHIEKSSVVNSVLIECGAIRAVDGTSRF